VRRGLTANKRQFHGSNVSVAEFIHKGHFQLQIGHCELDMNTLHYYGEGRRDRERERERKKQEKFCQHKSKAQHELGSVPKSLNGQ